MSGPRILRVRSAILVDPTGPRGLRTFMQGDEVPAKLLKQLGPDDLVPVGETVAEATSVTVPVAPDPLATSTEDLAKWLGESKATAPDVVALATPAGSDEPDPQRAVALMAAEQHMAGGDGRATVIGPLQKIVDADSGGAGDGGGGDESGGSSDDGSGGAPGSGDDGGSPS